MFLPNNFSVRGSPPGSVFRPLLVLQRRLKRFPDGFRAEQQVPMQVGLSATSQPETVSVSASAVTKQWIENFDEMAAAEERREWQILTQR